MTHTSTTVDAQPYKGGPVSLAVEDYTPEGNVAADVFLVHGYAEHAGRYGHVIEALNTAGLRVFTVDHRGHGRTTGVPRGVVDSFDALVDDLATVIYEKRSERPLFVYGHSMGGLAAVRLAERSGLDLAGVVVASASLMAAESIPAPLLKVANFLGKVAPSLGTIQLDGTAISRVDSVRESYDADPLNFRGKVPAVTGRSMNLAMAAAMSEAPTITVPVLIIHGDADRLCAISGSQQFFERVGSTDKTLRVWEGAFHELHNEPESDEVIGVVTQWIVDHAESA